MRLGHSCTLTITRSVLMLNALVLKRALQPRLEREFRIEKGIEHLEAIGL